MPQFIYHHGYAVPDYVKREPKVPRGGTYTTSWQKRGTYDTGKPGFSLGSDAFGADPITEFGNNVANTVIQEVSTLPKAEQAYALEVIFGKIEPGLWQKIKVLKGKLVERGTNPNEALRRAIAAKTSEGLVAEFAQAGRMGVVKPSAMGFFNPVSWVVKQGRGIGKGIGSAASVIGSTVKKIGGFACKVVSTDGGALAAGAAGGPAAAAGAKMMGGLCPPGQVAVPQQAVQQSKFPILPVALIAGAAVVAIVVLD